MSRRTPSPVFLNCGVVTPLHDSACPTLRVPHPPRSACFIAHPFHRPSPIGGLETFPLISRWLARPGGFPPIYFRKNATAGGSDARQKGPPWGTGGEAAELGPPDIERQESPLDRVPDQLGLIAQAKLSHQV